MTHVTPTLPLSHAVRRPRLSIDPAAVAAALFFLALFAAEMALILHGAAEIDPASLMGFVT